MTGRHSLNARAWVNERGEPRPPLFRVSRWLVRAALACWPPERAYRRRMRAEVDEWTTTRFWRRAATVDRAVTKTIAADKANRRAAMRAALGRGAPPTDRLVQR
jgi:hypothetical protein